MNKACLITRLDPSFVENVTGLNNNLQGHINSSIAQVHGGLTISNRDFFYARQNTFYDDRYTKIKIGPKIGGQAIGFSLSNRAYNIIGHNARTGPKKVPTIISWSGSFTVSTGDDESISWFPIPSAEDNRNPAGTNQLMTIVASGTLPLRFTWQYHANSVWNDFVPGDNIIGDGCRGADRGAAAIEDLRANYEAVSVSPASVRTTANSGEFRTVIATANMHLWMKPPAIHGQASTGPIRVVVDNFPEDQDVNYSGFDGGLRYSASITANIDNGDGGHFG